MISLPNCRGWERDDKYGTAVRRQRPVLWRWVRALQPLVCFKGEMLTGQLSGCTGPGFRGNPTTVVKKKKDSVLCLQISFKIQGLSYRHTKRPTCINPSRKYGERTGLFMPQSGIDVSKNIAVLRALSLRG